jgi:hypothetical protein
VSGERYHAIGVVIEHSKPSPCFLVIELVTAEAHETKEADSKRHIVGRGELARLNAEQTLVSMAAARDPAGGAKLVVVSDTTLAFLCVYTTQLLA